MSVTSVLKAANTFYKEFTAHELTTLESAGVDENKTLTWKNFKKVFSKVGWLMMQIGIVYFLSVMCTTSFTVATTAQILALYPERK